MMDRSLLDGTPLDDAMSHVPSVHAANASTTPTLPSQASPTAVAAVSKAGPTLPSQASPKAVAAVAKSRSPRAYPLS